MAERVSQKSSPMKERHSWIEEIDGLYFCRICIMNPTLLRTLRGSNKEEYFVTKGVAKHSDPGRKADAHIKQLSHNQAIDFVKVVSGEKKSMLDSMREQAIAEKAKNEADRNVYIKEYMRAAYWLFKNEIPHTTNFESLLGLLCLHDKDLCHFSKTRAANASYRSNTTVTEFLEIMSSVLDKNVATLLTRSISIFNGWTLLADEASIHGGSLLGIYARFIDPQTFEPMEEMIHCVPIQGTKSVDIFTAIDKVVKERNLNTSKLKFVSFDGAANMSSPNNGVYGLMKLNWNLPDLIERVDWRSKLFEQLNAFTDSLVTELFRRFGEDTEMLISFIPFNQKNWPDIIAHLKLPLFDTRALADEARHISEHINLSPQIDITSASKFWQSFLKYDYTRNMFPEHSFVSTLMLILPLGSCAVERCFSYSNRICSDSRSTLTLSHVSDLVRLSQQGPDFPKLSDISWPFRL